MFLYRWIESAWDAIYSLMAPRIIELWITALACTLVLMIMIVIKEW